MNETFDRIIELLPPARRMQYCYIEYRPWMRDKTHLFKCLVSWTLQTNNSHYIWLKEYGATAQEAAEKMVATLKEWN